MQRTRKKQETRFTSTWTSRLTLRQLYIHVTFYFDRGITHMLTK